MTPSQTMGPYFAMGLPWPDGPYVVPGPRRARSPSPAGVRRGRGAVPDALVETWQAGPDGRFDHPDDPRPAPSPPARGSAGSAAAPPTRTATYRIVTLRPGPLPAPGGGTEAPHLDVTVFARGLLDRVVTRIYLADEPDANAADPVLASVPEAGGRTLIATPPPGGEPGSFRFDIRLQDPQETVFFDL